MDPRKLLQAQLRIGGWTLVEAASALTEGEFLKKLPNAGESANWIFGHLAVNEDWFLSILTGSALRLPKKMHDVYQADFPASSHQPLPYGRSRLIAIFKMQRKRTMSALRKANPDMWNAPAPAQMPDAFKTLADVWGGIPTHQYWHIGQLMSIRAMLGKPAFQFPPHRVEPKTKSSGSDIDLVIPKDGPRLRPRDPSEVNPYVKAELDKATDTWGIPNHLARTMACHPMLALTEIDYANSFIFKENEFVQIPKPGKPADGNVLFPSAGFVDRITKELVINFVSLINRSRYSITHHGVISWGALSSAVEGKTGAERKARAEQMLLHLVDGRGTPGYADAPPFRGKPLYSEIHVEALRLAEAMNRDPHSVTDQQFAKLSRLLRDQAKAQIADGPLARQFGRGGPDPAYLDAYVDGMMVELTWNIAHFSGLLNRWFTTLKMRDEPFALDPQGQDFAQVYNQLVPKSIKRRNNSLLGANGWGG
jgi:hypothetical protein